MSNEDFDFDPSLPPDAADPVSFIRRQQQRALINAWSTPEDDPAKASRAVQLSRATGVDPNLIYGDQKNFEEQHRIALTSELLRNNQFLMDYAADPMAAKVSRDDWGRLDEYTTALDRTTRAVGNAALSAAREHFDLQHAFGSDQLPPDWVSNHRLLFSLATGAYGLALGLPMEAFGSGLAAAKAGVEELQVQMGVPRSTAASSSREMAAMVEAELMRLSGAPRIPPEALAPGLRAAEKARPYIERGELPPIGIDSIIDEAHKWQAKLDDKAGKEAISKAHATGTIDTPEAFEALTRKVVGDAKIGISAEAIAKLYGDEPPTVGDGKLGDLSGVREQYEMALRTGKDIEVPLAEWMAKTEPEVKKEILEGLRWRSGGMTLEESKRPAPPELEEPEKVTLYRAEGGKPTEGVVEPYAGVGTFYTDDPEMARKYSEVYGGAPIHSIEIDPNSTDVIKQSGHEWVIKNEALTALREPKPSAVDTVREASGVVPGPAARVRPVLPPEGVIPPTSLIGQVTTQRGMDVVPSSTFALRDGLALIKSERLNDFQASLTEFFKDRLGELVGDTKVHALEDTEFNKLARKIFNTTGSSIFGGWFDQTTGDIVARASILRGEEKGGHGNAVSLLLHEGAHALSYAAMREKPLIGSLFEAMRAETVRHLMDIGDKETLTEVAYYLTNRDEFVAGGYEHHGFRETLAATPISDNLAGRIGLGKGKNTMWDAFRQLISDVLYWAVGKRLDNTMLDAFLKMQEHFEKPTAGIESEGLPSPAPLQPELPGMTRMEDRPLFERARLIGLSKDRYAKWVKAVNERGEEKAKLEKDRELKEESLRQSQEWKSALKETRKTVSDEVRSRPDFASDTFLREGGEIGGQHVRKQRLDEKLVPEEFKGKIPKDYVGDRGLNPDHVASIFGFNNSRSLLTSLARLEEERQLAGLTPEAHLRATIDAETERRVRGELGDSHQAIMKEIEDHVYSPATIDMVSEEMLGMAEKAGAQLPISGDNAKAWVREQFNAGKMGTHSFKAYQSAAQRAEMRITDAFLEGRENDAFQDYQRKYVSMLAANEARRLEKEQARADTLFKRLSKRVVENLPEEFTNYLHQLMGRGGFNFGPGGIRRTAGDLAERIDKVGPATFDAFTQKIADRGFPIQVPNFLYTSWAKPQEEMTVNEWRAWSGMIRSLYNIGRKENTFLKEGRELDRQEFVGSANEQIAKHGPQLPKLSTPSRFKEMVGQSQSIAYSLIWVESIWNRFDFGNKYGLFNTAFSYPASRAVNQYTVWIKEFSKELSALEKSHVAKREILPQIFKDHNGRFVEDTSHDSLRQALLYAGTPSGYRKLIEGWMLADVPKEAREAAFPLAANRFEQWVHDHATKEDWEYVGKIWDVNKRIFEKYEDMTKELDIVPAQKIPLRAMVDKWGRRWDGGYTKLIYDEKEFQQSAKAAKIKSYDPEDSMSSSGFFQGASTPRSHEIERTGYVGPLYLRTDRNPFAMSNVLRDAAVRPFVVNTSKIWSDPKFREALRERGFGHVEDMLDPYLKAVGGMGERIDEASRIAHQWIDYFSRSTVSRLIGWSLTTAAKHGLSAAVNSIAEVGVKNWVREEAIGRAGATDLADFYRSLAPNIDIGPKDTNRAIAMYRSQQLQERSKSILETMGGQVERLAGSKTPMQRLGDWFERHNSAIVAWADLESAIPTWTAAFKESIAEQSRDGEVSIGLAEDIADRAVRRAHGSTSMATRPSAMRGSPMAMTVMRLYGYWNSLLQRNYEAMWRTKFAMDSFERKDYAEGLRQIPAITWLAVSSQIAPMLVEYAIEGVPDDKKDSTPLRVAKMFALVTSSTIPIVREAVRGYLYGFPTTMGVLDTALGGVHDAIKDLDVSHWGAKAFDAEHGGKTIRALAALFATTTRVGNQFIEKSLKTMWDATHRNKETPKTPYELGRDIVKGHPREMHR